MKNKSIALSILVSIALVVALILPASVGGTSTVVSQTDDYSNTRPTMDTLDFGSVIALNSPDSDCWVTPMVVAGRWDTVGLKSDGTLLVTAGNYFPDKGELEGGGYRVAEDQINVIQVATAGGEYPMWDVTDPSDPIPFGVHTGHTVILCDSGWMLAWGPNWDDECRVQHPDWTDIIQIDANAGYIAAHETRAFTVGLKSNGRVVTTGSNYWGQLNVDTWPDVKQISAGNRHLVGLKDDDTGTVVSAGSNFHGQRNLYAKDGWKDIIQVAAGGGHTVGLKRDGTVIAEGLNNYDQCKTEGWTDIIQVDAGDYHTVGLRSDGIVLATGYSEGDDTRCKTSGWSDIIQVAAGGSHTVGLRADGEVVATGYSYLGSCAVGSWNLGACARYLTISGSGGEVTRPGEGTFPYYPGRMVNLVAGEGDIWWEWDRWSGDVQTIDDVNAASTTITMDGDYHVTASFWSPLEDIAEALGRTLYVRSTAGGQVTEPGEGLRQYFVGMEVDLKAEAGLGSYFEYWSAFRRKGLQNIRIPAGESPIDDYLKAETTITMDDNYLVVAHFTNPYAAVPLGPLSKFELIVTAAAGGFVTEPGWGVFDYYGGQVVDLNAVPLPGHRFVNWTGDVDTIADVEAASTNITMNDDYSITANFVPQYVLEIHSTEGGHVATPGEPGPFYYDGEAEVNLLAKADEGYHFVEWAGNVDTVAAVKEAATTITMKGDYSITAVFATGDPCFIATAAYGAPMAEEIEVLREFRDEYLLTNAVGRALVDVYYRVSPPIAEFISERPSLKPMVRTGLLPAVAMSAVAVNTTANEKAVTIGLLVLVSAVLVAVWTRRRRGRGSEYLQC